MDSLVKRKITIFYQVAGNWAEAKDRNFDFTGVLS